MERGLLCEKEERNYVEIHGTTADIGCPPRI